MNKTALCLCVFLSGAVIGFLINDIPYLSFDRVINPVDLINLFLTFIIAVYVKIILDKKKNIADILIDMLDDYLLHLKKMNDLFENIFEREDSLINEQDKIYIMHHLNVLEMMLGEFENVVKESSKGLSKESFFDHLKNSHLKFWKDISADVLVKGKTLDAEYHQKMKKAIISHKSDLVIGKIKFFKDF